MLPPGTEGDHTMQGTALSPRGLAAVLSCPILVLLCVGFVDRTAADLSHAVFSGHVAIFVWLTHIVDPVPPLAGFGLAGAGLAAILGWRPGPAGRTFVGCCIAVLVAIAIKDQLKWAFGRLWPETWVNNNPSWIHDGAYGFFPFHGGQGWFSFPSGHTTIITAPVAALWERLPKWRLVLALPVVLVVVGLFGADYHFVGDMVAGFYLGAASGIGAAALLRDRPGPAFATPPI